MTYGLVNISKAFDFMATLAFFSAAVPVAQPSTVACVGAHAVVPVDVLVAQMLYTSCQSAGVDLHSVAAVHAHGGVADAGVNVQVPMVLVAAPHALLVSCAASASHPAFPAPVHLLELFTVWHELGSSFSYGREADAHDASVPAHVPSFLSGPPVIKPGLVGPVEHFAVPSLSSNLW